MVPVMGPGHLSKEMALAGVMPLGCRLGPGAGPLDRGALRNLRVQMQLELMVDVDN